MRTEDLQKQELETRLTEIRKSYTDLLKELLETGDILPEWVFNPAAACACGDKCSVGKTDANKLDQRIFPEAGVK